MAITIDRTSLLGRIKGSTLLSIVAINVAIWLLLRLIVLIFFWSSGGDNIEHEVCRWVELPSSPSEWKLHFYGIFTYMWAQYDIWHILWNMLWLYWFGRIFLEISSGRTLTWVYIYGGLAGGVLFVAAYNLIPHFAGVAGWLIGSSASVLCVVTATAILMPDYPVNLLFIGSVKLKWVAIVSIVLVLLSVNNASAGGEIAHLGGIVMGAIYGCMRRQGHDLTYLLRRRHKAKRVPKSSSPRTAGRNMPKASEADRAELDRILDKIKTSGYGGLTAAERKRLFEVSSRIK